MPKPKRLAQRLLFVIDLDGTLLNPDGEVAPPDREAVAAALFSGCEVLLCTGRGQRMTDPVLQALPPECYAACHNGALLLRPDGTVLARTFLAPAAATATIDTLIGAGLEPLVYREETPTRERSNTRLLARPQVLATGEADAYLASKGSQLLVVEALAAAAGDRAFGIAVFGPEGKLRQALVPLAAFRDEVRSWVAPFRDRYVLEVVARAAGKASALRTVCAQLSIPRAGSVAFGDNINDLDMLEAAGVAVAMANAEAAVKAVATWTTGDNRSSGVATAIARVLRERGVPTAAPAPG